MPGGLRGGGGSWEGSAASVPRPQLAPAGGPPQQQPPVAPQPPAQGPPVQAGEAQLISFD